MIKLKRNNKQGFVAQTFTQREGLITNLISSALLAVIMLLAVTACKRDGPDEINPKDDGQVDEKVDDTGLTPGRLVEPSFFGAHISTATLQPWPPLDKFSAVRLVSLVEKDDEGNYTHLNWAYLNPSEGVFNWKKLDEAVKIIQDHGKDIMYTFYGRCIADVDIDDWKEFVTAIVTRYDGNHGYGKIKFWELWNEPNSSISGCEEVNTYTKMFEMAEAAYPIIKAADPENIVVSPAPQGFRADYWMGKFFEAGGGGDQLYDVIAFHSYFFGGEPELLVTMVETMRELQARYPALSGKPFWDTEHCWGDDFSSDPWRFAANEDEQIAWMARHIIISASVGIERTFWYQWDGYEGQIHWGWFYNRNKSMYRKPGLAYHELYAWLIGAEISKYTSNSEGVWQCRLVRPDGYRGLIVWAGSKDPSFTTTFKVPTGYKKYRNLDGNTVKTSGGSVLKLTMKPILLENQ